MDEDNEDVDLEQEAVHEALQRLLDLKGEDVLTGWVVCYEGMGPDGTRRAGHLYGPSSMTIWGALGLVDWARRVTLMEGNTFNIEGDDDDS